jgi:predicted aldo/keto reductase-like oxidoreductase
MSESMNRRVFLERAAQTVAAGAALGGIRALGAETQPATQPAVEWRNRQPTMGYAKLGRTGFMTSRCAFGAGGLYARSGELRLLEIAIDRGMNYIDTGRAYGSSERAIAGLLKRLREKVWIVSKAGHIGWPDMTVKPGEDAKAAKLYRDQLDKSLRELGTETIDCYMVQGVEHEWIVTSDAIYDAFVRARKAGKVRFFGLSTHTNVPRVCGLAAKSGRYDVVMVAVNPNSLERLRPVVQAMRDAGIGVVSMKTSGPITKDPKTYDARYGGMYDGVKMSPYQRAYAYLLHRGGVDAFNSHMPNRRILEENLAVPTLKLGRAALDRIERDTLAETRGACTHCGDCTRACPADVPAADLLRYHAYAMNYGEPAAAEALYRRYGASRAGACDGCGACATACPAGIDLPGVIRSVRTAWA